MAAGEYNPEVSGAQKQTQQAANTLRAVPTPPPEEPMPELGVDEEPDYTPQGDEEMFLFGDATGEGRDFAQPTGRRIPPEVVRKLPALARAAQAADAPPALVALYRMTVRELENEMKTLG